MIPSSLRTALGLGACCLLLACQEEDRPPLYPGGGATGGNGGAGGENSSGTGSTGSETGGGSSTAQFFVLGAEENTRPSDDNLCDDRGLLIAELDAQVYTAAVHPVTGHVLFVENGVLRAVDAEGDERTAPTFACGDVEEFTLVPETGAVRATCNGQDDGWFDEDGNSVPCSWAVDRDGYSLCGDAVIAPDGSSVALSQSVFYYYDPATFTRGSQAISAIARARPDGGFWIVDRLGLERFSVATDGTVTSDGTYQLPTEGDPVPAAIGPEGETYATVPGSVFGSFGVRSLWLDRAPIVHFETPSTSCHPAGGAIVIAVEP